jgi:hypothetical protein
VHPTLHILDVRLEVSSDQEALIEPFLGVFSAFSCKLDASGAEDAARPMQVRVDGAGGSAETAAFLEKNYR